MFAHAALTMLERQEPVAENPLLLTICYASLHSTMTAMVEKAQAKASEDTKTEE